MPTEVVTSVASRCRIERARIWLETRNPAEELLILGATLAAASDLVRGLAKSKGSAFGWHRLTLAQLAASIALPGLIERGVASVSQIGSEATVARLVHRSKTEGRIGRFEPIAATPGFPRAIAAVITELRLAHLSPVAVSSAAPDLAPLLAAYEAELVELALTDWPGILSLAGERVRAHRLAGLPLLMLDVPIANEAELAFVRALACETPEILATVPTADEPTLTKLHDELNWPIEDLDRASFSGPCAAPVTDAPLQTLQRNLFKASAASAATRPATGVEIFSAPGEGRECVEIARRVLARAREGTPFDRIAILLRSPEEYRANLEEAFDRAAIPVHFARGARRPDPAGRAFYALLRCAAASLSARRFAEYLSLGQVPDAAAGGAPPAVAPRGDQWVAPDSEAVTEETAEEPERQQAHAVSEGAVNGEQVPVREGQLRAPRRWEQLLVEAAVIGSRDRWRRRRHRSGLMRVTDHKTGKFDGNSGQIIAGGTSLQPLLYALAAEKMFAGEGVISCGRLYFCTSRGGFAAQEVPLDDQARAAAVQVAETVGDAVAQAFLPAYPAEGECARCDYRVVCGPHEERRIARKPAGNLEPLLTLRGAP
jgi:ATP-dependent helicase/nuclease subunit B